MRMRQNSNSIACGGSRFSRPARSAEPRTEECCTAPARGAVCLTSVRSRAKSRPNSARRACAVGFGVCWILWAVGCQPSPPRLLNKAAGQTEVRRPPIKGVLVRPEQVTETAIAEWQKAKSNVLLLVERSNRNEVAQACRDLQASGVTFDYWLEIARCAELADSHPEWMCSLQGHSEWRRLNAKWQAFPDDRQHVTKTYPWVPVLYRESFSAQLDRVRELLAELPSPSRIWLNDLQSGPSACGCGHPLCRWAGDYGPITTATPLGDGSAADFLAAVQKLAENVEVIPVWTTECEEADEHEACGGVGCFDGICWRAFAQQLAHLDPVAPRIGVQCYDRLFARDLPRYGPPGGWITQALNSFSEMPPRRGGTAVPTHRLVPFLQAWDADPQHMAAQIRAAESVGAGGYVLVLTPIDQSWEPRSFEIGPDRALQAWDSSVSQ